MIFDLVKDFADVLEGMPEGHSRRRILRLLDEAIRRDVHFIDRHPTTLFQCLWNTCWWYDCPEAAKHYEKPAGGWSEAPPWERTGPKLYQLLDQEGTNEEQIRPWLRSLRPPAIALGAGLLMEFQGHRGSVASAAFSSDGKRIVSGGSDSTVRVWNVESAKQDALLEGHTKMVNCVKFIPGRQWVISTSADNTIRASNFETGKLIRRLKPDRQPKCVACSPDGRRIVYGGISGTLEVWDIFSGRRLTTLDGETHGVRSVAYSADGTRIVSAAHCNVRVWDSESGRQISLIVLSAAILGMSLDHDGRRILCGCVDNRIRLVDLATGKLVSQFEGHARPVHGVALSPDGRRIASSSGDKTVRVWDAMSGSLLRVLEQHREATITVAFGPDGGSLVTGGDVVRVWSIDNEPCTMRPTGHNDQISRVFTSPDGQYFVSTSTQHTMRLWNASTAEHVSEFTGHSGAVTSVAFSPCGRHVVSGSTDNTVRLWNIATGTETACYEGHKDSLDNVAFSPNGRRIVSKSDDSIRIWRVENEEEQSLLVRLWKNLRNRLMRRRRELCILRPSDAKRLAFSPDGRRFAASSEWKDVCIWDGESGRQIAEVEFTSSCRSNLTFSPDSRHVACGCVDGRIRVIDVESEEVSLQIDGHTKRVDCVAFSPDGRRIVSGSYDNTVRIWKFGRPDELEALECHTGGNVTSVGFSRGGQRVFSSSWPGIVHVWDAEDGELLMVHRNIKSEDRDFTDQPDDPVFHPWQLGTSEIGFAIELKHNRELVAWFSKYMFRTATHPSGRKLIAADGSHVYILELAGDAMESLWASDP
ncbi:MAG: hypothetical protein DWQ34_06545 [Planctomycetota bacterium]|nr:MAG: hypothetical protein DWQ34_06545 [Planctomycetota bacterium]